MDVCRRPGWPQQRWLGFVFGLGTQLLFLITVWYLFWFLKDGMVARAEQALLWDALLCLQFSVVHSWLLHPSTKRGITKFLVPELYGCLFCVATCSGLLLMLAGWQGSSIAIWDLQGAAKIAVTACYFGSWGMLFYSLSLTGLQYQTGLGPWWNWLRRQPQSRRQFDPRGAYLWMRHPVYLGFLGLIWFTPRMTLDHAVLTGLWTVYVFLGSYLKDERLAYYYGATYRAYQSRVPGFPLIGFGPLGLRCQPAMPVGSVVSTAAHSS